MKKNLLMVLKMAAIVSFKGLFCQIILFNILLATAPSSAQNLKDIRINLSVNNITVEKALQIIEEKTNFKFNYIKDDLPSEGTVNIDVNSESLYNILASIAKDYSLVFKRVNEQITVRKAEEKEETIITSIETCTLKGYVIDGDTKEALQGVTVAIKGTTIGTFTDKRGYYEINNLKPGKYTIVATYVGYAANSKEIILTSGKTVEINFQLGQSAFNVDEVVVTGSISERSIKESANPVAILTTAELETRNLTFLTDVLSTLPGVTANAEADASTNWGQGNAFNSYINIRGSATGYATSPSIKYYLDGVEIYGASTLNFIDPNQIERIEVSKGPMSSTLYGAGSSEGILQIFTKHGMGKLSVNFKTTFTSQESKYQDASPLNSQYSLALIGSKGDVSYNFGANYAVFPISRWATNNGIDENDWSFNAGVAGKIGDIAADLKIMKGMGSSGVGVINQYHRIALEQGWSNPNATSINPAYYDIHYKSKQLITSLNLKQALSDNLYHSLNTSYSEIQQYQNYYTGTKYADGTYSYQVTDNSISMTTAKYFMNWNQSFSDFFKIDLTGGFDISYNYMVSNKDRYTTPFDDDVLLTGNPKATVSQGGSMTNDTKALYIEGVWGFWNKLFVTTGIRTERNNSYGDNSGWYKIPRVGATYVIELGDFTIKPRISWGESTQPVSAMYKVDKISTQGTMTIWQVGNPDLKPQKQAGYEIGGDLFYTTNFSFNFTYYHQKFTDMVTQQNIPDPTVFIKYQFINLQSVLNNGVEISARAIVNPFTIDIAYTHLTSVYGPGFPAVSTSGNPESHEGGRILNIPSGSFVARVSYTVPALLPWSSRGGNITLEYISQGDEYNQDYIIYYRTLVETGKGQNVYKEFPSYYRINMRGDYVVVNNVSLFFDIQNLLNNQDMLYSGPLKGRTIAFGLNYKL